MKNFKLTMAGLFLLVAALLLTTCSEPRASVDASGAGAEYAFDVKEIPGTVRVKHPIKWDIGTVGGTWRDTYREDPKSYNAFSNLDGTHSTVTGMMLDYLFDYDPLKREWKGFLIKDYEVIFDEEADTMELICELRDDILWSDGVQMTADDVVWWYYEIEGDPDIYPVGYQGQFIKMDDGSQKRIEVEKVDKLKYKYIFPRIVANPLLVVNTGNIVPKHIWEPVKREGGKEAVMDFWGLDTPPEDLVGNGAYLLEKNVPGERLIYKRNPNYWQKDEGGNRLPYVETVILTQVPDTNAELLKFQKGEIEGYGLRGQDMATLLPKAEESGYSVWNGGPSNGYPALIFNNNPRAISEVKYSWFTNKRFRHAVSCLIDRKTIIDQTINGLATPQYHIIAETNRYFDPQYATPYRYNLEQAAEILAEIGFKDTDSDEILEDEGGNAISFDIMTSSKDPILHDYINIIITDMKKVGIKANLNVVDFNVVAQKILHTHDWDCYLAGFSFPTFPEQWYNIWRSDGNLHYWHPKQESPSLEWEKKIDELYAKLEYTFDEKKIKELYGEFQRVLMDELVIIPIFRKYSFLAVYDKWGNVNWDVNHSMGDGNVRLYLKPAFQGGS